MGYKLLVREIVSLKLCWKKVIPEELGVKLRRKLKEVVQVKLIHFPRSFEPGGTSRSPVILGFLGEMRSFSQRLLYVRHKLDRQGPGGETHSVWLLAGKSRVTPLKGTTMRRIELSGLLVLLCLLCSLCICLPPTVEVIGCLQAPNG